MGKFILQVICFFGVSLLLFLGVHLMLLNTRNTLLKFPEGKKTLYLGNSTVECAINDSICNTSINFARRTEPINYLYAKVKLLKEINPQIDTIIMGIDDIILFNNNLSYINGASLYFLDQFDSNDWTNNFSNSSFKRYSSLFSHLYDYKKILPMLKSYFNNDIPVEELEIGGHLKLQRNKLKNDIEDRKIHPQPVYKLNDFPQFNKYYLDRIVKYCEANGIKLIFLSTPKHKEVWKESTYVTIHNKYYSQIELIDLMKYPLDDNYFGDCIHLNYDGAILFTNYIEKTILNK